ncbi:THO complex subunit 6 homolog [Patella vulgata]|uniref:THO complex subunit 6 homolog n=1 Tax=Patella vulgata TaxID=6465 RepID=UPI00217F40BB|nr:THO complex subunit 6 homolog [Patella vulgata]
MQEQSLQSRQLYHMTIFTQCFSPCGKYIAAANNYGQIAIFSLVSALSPEANESSRLPIYCFKGCKEGAIYCLTSTDTFLISAGEGDICAWKWSDIHNKAPKIIWSLSLPKKGVFTNPEVNSMVVDKQEQATRLLAGGGDNDIHIWNMENGQLENSLQGHEDYVHSICLKNNGRECVSASEDGTVRIWDARSSSEAVHILEPHKTPMCGRPEMGKWVGCVAMDHGDDWLICGGGPKLSTWHLRSLTPTATFDTPGSCQNFVMYHEENVISGGMKPCVNHWYVNGDLKSQVPTTSSSIYNIAVNTVLDQLRVLSVVGNSCKIDVCTNFGYKAFSLKFVPS